MRSSGSGCRRASVMRGVAARRAGCNWAIVSGHSPQGALQLLVGRAAGRRPLGQPLGQRRGDGLRDRWSSCATRIGRALPLDILPDDQFDQLMGDRDEQRNVDQGRPVPARRPRTPGRWRSRRGGACRRASTTRTGRCCVERLPSPNCAGSFDLVGDADLEVAQQGLELVGRARRSSPPRSRC